MTMLETALWFTMGLLAGTLITEAIWRQVIHRFLRRLGFRVRAVRAPDPPFPEFKLPTLDVQCPKCGTRIGLEISGGYGPPDDIPPLPGGMTRVERLLREKRFLEERLDPDDPTLDRYRERIAAIERELKQFQ